jgi:hypothetical protein
VLALDSYFGVHDLIKAQSAIIRILDASLLVQAAWVEFGTYSEERLDVAGTSASAHGRAGLTRVTSGSMRPEGGLLRVFFG